MKFWDYDKHPYRPVAPRRVFMKLPDGGGEYRDLPPDVFQDAAGRFWFAGTDILRASLPADPESVPKIPPKFWHPDAARQHEDSEHTDRKRELEDERIEGRRPHLV